MVNSAYAFLWGFWLFLLNANSWRVYRGLTYHPNRSLIFWELLNTDSYLDSEGKLE